MVVETVLLSESFLRRWTLRRDGFQGWSTVNVLRLDEQQLAYRGEDMLRDIGYLNTRFLPSCNCRLQSHQNSLETNIRPGEIVTVRPIPCMRGVSPLLCQVLISVAAMLVSS